MVKVFKANFYVKKKRKGRRVQQRAHLQELLCIPHSTEINDVAMVRLSDNGYNIYVGDTTSNLTVYSVTCVEE